MLTAVSSFDLITPWGDVKYSSEPLTSIRTYDGLGGCFTFLPFDNYNWNYAIDAESKNIILPELVTAKLGTDPAKLWNHIEIISKLIDIPSYLIFKAIRRKGLNFFKEFYKIEFYDCDTTEHWITLGRCKKQTQGY